MPVLAASQWVNQSVREWASQVASEEGDTEWTIVGVSQWVNQPVSEIVSEQACEHASEQVSQCESVVS